MLKTRAFTAVMWSVLELGGGTALATIFVLILARFLAPADFGVFAASMFVTRLMSQIAFLGMERTLVQRDRFDRDVLGTAFWMLLCNSSVAALVLWLGSDMISQWFGDARIAAFLPYFAATMVLAAGRIVFTTALRRELQMKAMAQCSLTASLVAGTVAVALAVQGFGVTALLAQISITACLNLVLAWILLGTPNTFAFDWNIARSLVTFGLPISGANLLDFMSKEGPKLFVGLFLGTTALGIFAMGARVTNLIVTICGLAVDRVSLPVLSEVRRTSGRVRGVFLRMVRLSGAVTLPLFAVAIILREEVILTLLGPQWIGAAPVIAFMAGAGILITLNILNDTTIVALGKAGARLWFSLVRAATGAILLGVMTPFGLHFAAAAVLLQALIAEPLPLLYLLRRIDSDLGSYLAHLRGAVLASGVLLVAAIVVRAAMDGFPAAIVLVTAAGACLLSYLVAIRRFDPRLVEELRTFVAIRPRGSPV